MLLCVGNVKVGLRYDCPSLYTFDNLFENALRSFDMWLLRLIIKVNANVICRLYSTTSSWMRFQRLRVVFSSYVAPLKVKLMLRVNV